MKDHQHPQLSAQIFNSITPTTPKRCYKEKPYDTRHFFKSIIPGFFPLIINTRFYLQTFIHNATFLFFF